MCRRLGPNVSHFEEPYAIAEKSDNPRTCADEEQSFGRNAEARRPECAWRIAAGERRVSTDEKLHTGDCLANSCVGSRIGACLRVRAATILHGWLTVAHGDMPVCTDHGGGYKLGRFSPWKSCNFQEDAPDAPRSLQIVPTD